MWADLQSRASEAVAKRRRRTTAVESTLATGHTLPSPPPHVTHQRDVANSHAPVQLDVHQHHSSHRDNDNVGGGIGGFVHDSELPRCANEITSEVDKAGDMINRGQGDCGGDVCAGAAACSRVDHDDAQHSGLHSRPLLTCSGAAHRVDQDDAQQSPTSHCRPLLTGVAAVTLQRQVVKLPHPLRAPIRYTDAGVPICRFHNYRIVTSSWKGPPCKDGDACACDHEHCHLCGVKGHIALECDSATARPLM
jgi:hypothetical protein